MEEQREIEPLALLDEEDIPKPWHKLPDEPLLWYRRFVLYLKLPFPRTTFGAFVKEHKRTRRSRQRQRDDKGMRLGRSLAPTAWLQAKNDYRWKERAEAYDLDLIRAELEQRQKEVEEEIKAELADSLKLRKVGRELISLPVLQEERESYREEDRPEGTVTIHTVLTQAADAEHFRAGAQLLKEARTSARLALGLPTANNRTLVSDLTERELLEIKDRLNAYYQRQAANLTHGTGTVGTRAGAQSNIIEAEYSRDEDPDLNG